MAIVCQENGKDVSPWHDVPLRNADGTLNFVCGTQRDTCMGLSLKAHELQAISIVNIVQSGALTAYIFWGCKQCKEGACWLLCRVPLMGTGSARARAEGLSLTWCCGTQRFPWARAPSWRSRRCVLAAALLDLVLGDMLTESLQAP